MAAVAAMLLTMPAEDVTITVEDIATGVTTVTRRRAAYAPTSWGSLWARTTRASSSRTAKNHCNIKLLTYHSQMLTFGWAFLRLFVYRSINVVLRTNFRFNGRFTGKLGLLSACTVLCKEEESNCQPSLTHQRIITTKIPE